MRVGVVFPQTEIGADPGVVREYVEAAEGVGYDHLAIYDHVLGASLANRPNWSGPYHSGSMFHEVLVLFGYLAAITSRIELVTSVVIAPQRQTALLAKQAAEIDVLSGGRLRLGIGTGWNEVEYIGLNEEFRNRGRRMDEQIAVMRALWTNETVDFKGRWHTIPEAGINPLPVQRPIPIWLGGYVDAVMERVGRLGDGWFPRGLPGPELDHWLSVIKRAAEAAGRDPAQIGMEGRINLAPGGEAQWEAHTEAWRKAGATHMSVNTMGAGRSPGEHLEAIRRYREVLASV